jgi:hypothetical protein
MGGLVWDLDLMPFVSHDWDEPQQLLTGSILFCRALSLSRLLPRLPGLWR